MFGLIILMLSLNDIYLTESSTMGRFFSVTSYKKQNLHSNAERLFSTFDTFPENVYLKNVNLVGGIYGPNEINQGKPNYKHKERKQDSYKQNIDFNSKNNIPQNFRMAPKTFTTLREKSDIISSILRIKPPAVLPFAKKTVTNIAIAVATLETTTKAFKTLNVQTTKERQKLYRKLVTKPTSPSVVHLGGKHFVTKKINLLQPLLNLNTGRAYKLNKNLNYDIVSSTSMPLGITSVTTIVQRDVARARQNLKSNIVDEVSEILFYLLNNNKTGSYRAPLAEISNFEHEDENLKQIDQMSYITVKPSSSTPENVLIHKKPHAHSSDVLTVKLLNTTEITTVLEMSTSKTLENFGSYVPTLNETTQIRHFKPITAEVDKLSENLENHGPYVPIINDATQVKHFKPIAADLEKISENMENLGPYVPVVNDTTQIRHFKPVAADLDKLSENMENLGPYVPIVNGTIQIKHFKPITTDSDKLSESINAPELNSVTNYVPINFKNQIKAMYAAKEKTNSVKSTTKRTENVSEISTIPNLPTMIVKEDFLDVPQTPHMQDNDSTIAIISDEKTSSEEKENYLLQSTMKPNFAILDPPKSTLDDVNFLSTLDMLHGIEFDKFADIPKRTTESHVYKNLDFQNGSEFIEYNYPEYTTQSSDENSMDVPGESGLDKHVKFIENTTEKHKENNLKSSTKRKEDTTQTINKKKFDGIVEYVHFSGTTEPTEKYSATHEITKFIKYVHFPEHTTQTITKSKKIIKETSFKQKSKDEVEDNQSIKLRFTNMTAMLVNQKHNPDKHSESEGEKKHSFSNTKGVEPVRLTHMSTSVISDQKPSQNNMIEYSTKNDSESIQNETTTKTTNSSSHSFSKTMEKDDHEKNLQIKERRDNYYQKAKVNISNVNDWLDESSELTTMVMDVN